MKQTIAIQQSICADDSCQQQLYAKGHFDSAEFLEACRGWLLAYHRLAGEVPDTVRWTYWRTVRVGSDTSICVDYMFKESRKGRGAYAVTILDCWLPLFR